MHCALYRGGEWAGKYSRARAVSREENTLAVPSPPSPSPSLSSLPIPSSDPPAFHALLLRHTEAILPYVYTPTVGEACQRYHALPGLTPTGIYLTPADAATPGAVAAKLRSYRPPGSSSPSTPPCIVIVTDGARILGLGDLGAGGLGIAEGKALLYTAAGGVPPTALVPVCLDVGTDNASLLADPAYRGLRAKRAPAEVLDALVGALFAAVREWRPRAALIHFEDFASASAFRLLARYGGGAAGLPAFNDDIEGTASVALAAILAGLRLTGGDLAAQRLLFFGAGEAGAGIGELVAAALVSRCGLPLAAARARCVFVDSSGLVTSRRPGPLAAHKAPFAHDLPFVRTLADAVALVRPTVLVGVSAVAGAFSPAVLGAMADLNGRPIILPLSNPTHLAECSLAQALEGTGGRGIVATGSPFPPHAGRAASQANNAYIFPGVGLAALVTRASRLGPGAFLAAAECLALQATAEEQEAGLLFPRFSRVADASAAVAAAVAAHLIASGDGMPPEGAAYAAMGGRAVGATALEAYVRGRMVNLAGGPPRL